MAESSSSRRQPSRLQRRAPASIKINRSSDWNVAIPLLSPVVASPPSNRLFNQTAEIESRQGQQLPSGPEQKPAVFNKWHHPAAPFFYEPVPLSSSVRVERAWLLPD
ncbi:hypothetical protein Nepgr_021802 [Nepenthes gracilis]|uniref:Uncharacterized protein n=1 Tax=Nepenthes gracilis TaxID=150966 RepID=A0AAD3SZP0_NEPGR|nr:hypothetical protein Nepgr_021802 [Nepenthes gracilis]